MGFCQQRGEGSPADAGKRSQDVHVTLCVYSRRILALGQGGDQPVDLLVGFGDVCADESQLGEDDPEMGAGRLRCARRDGDGGRGGGTIIVNGP